jgi:hypothetical protein
MKTIKFLRRTTLAEIYLNVILLILLLAGLQIRGGFYISGWAFCGIVILHTSSMLLHWLVWKQLPVTHWARAIFTTWVLGTFAALFICFELNEALAFLMLYLLMLFAIAWYVYYFVMLCYEYKFLKRKEQLYEQRELVHF